MVMLTISVVDLFFFSVEDKISICGIVLFCWKEITVVENVLSSFRVTECMVFVEMKTAGVWDVHFDSKTFEW